MKESDFYVPQRGPHKWYYFLKGLKLQDIFSSNLKGLFESTINILNAPEPKLLLNFLKTILSTDKEKELNKIYFSIGNISTISRYNFFLYDKSNFIEKTFITELNKRVTLYGSISYFCKKKENGVNIINPENKLPVSIDQNTDQEKIRLHLSKLKGKLIDLKESRIENFSI